MKSTCTGSCALRLAEGIRKSGMGNAPQNTGNVSEQFYLDFISLISTIGSQLTCVACVTMVSYLF